MAQNIKPLGLKASKFCDEYVKENNGTQAAKDAGYSKKTAGQQANSLLKDPRVQDRIDQLLKEQQKRTQTDADKIIEEYAKIGFINIQSLLDKDDKFKRIIDLEPHISAAIKKVKETETRIDEKTVSITREIELYDKLNALRSLGDHFRIFDKESATPTEEIKINVEIFKSKRKPESKP